MAKGNSPATTTPSTYELLSAGVQRVINSSAAQKSRSVVLLRAEGDSPDNWSRILDEISENDNVTIAWRDDGVQLFWTVPKED